MKQQLEVFLGVTCVPFPTLGKNKEYFDEYGHKTLNCTKIAVFVCQNVLMRTQINLRLFLLIKR